MNIDKKGFNNSLIKEREYGKPHIVKIGRYWRVSPWKRNTGSKYYEAHAFINQLNGGYSWGKEE